MKSFRKILCFSLALIMVFAVASCDSNSIKELAGKIPFIGSDGTEEASVVDDTLNGYLIIRSDAASNAALEISSDIRKAFEELGYTDVAVKTDYAGKDNPPEKEILVGTTNRPESVDTSAFSDNDFAVKGEGHKILLAAKNDEALDKAAQHFVSEILPKLHSGEMKCDEVDYVYTYQFNVKNVFLGDAPIEKCELVIGEDVSGAEKNAISAFEEKIYTLSGKRFGTSLEEGEKAEACFYFGGDSDEVSLLKAKLGKDEYGFCTASDGKSFVCASNARYGLLKATEQMSDEFFGGFSDEFVSAGVSLATEGQNIVKGAFVHETVNSLAANALETTLEAANTKTIVAGLKVDGLANPMGLDSETPEFSWYMGSPEYNESQISYRIGVASSAELLANGEYDVWDSGSVLTSENTAVLPFAEPEEAEHDTEDDREEQATSEPKSRLEKSTRYYWNVTLHTNRGHSVSSEPSFFETGLMDGAFSDASWICADDYHCTATAGVVEAKFTLGKNAAGVSFGISENEDFYYMWQFNTSNRGYGVLRPHVYKDGAWSYLPEVSLKEMFPDAESASAAPIVMKIDINNGIITTSINDTVVSTNTVDTFPIGNVKQRLSGGESAEYEYVRIVDESGAVLYDGKKSDAAPMYRQDFLVDNPEMIVSARLYASALGAYDVYLNGTKLGNSFLNPGRTAYNEQIYYQTYDVTKLITATNAIAAIVGDGWYNSAIVGGSYGERNAFIARLVIKLNDGTERTVTTGDGWQFTLDGPVTYADFYDGQGYDARLEIPGFDVYGGVNGWQKARVLTDENKGALMSGTYEPGKLVAEAMEPVRSVSDIKPIGVTNPAPGIFVYDFGQNIAGTLTLNANAESGTQINLTYSEKISAAEPHVVETAYMLGHNGIDRYTFAGKPGGESFTPTLVYHGFRYVQIEGLPEALPLENLTAHVLSSDLERTGSFESGNVLLNKYYNNTIRSQQSNFVSNLTDCPTREKNGWTGDAQIFAKTGSFNMNVRNIYENFMEMLRMSTSNAGAVPEILPSRGTSNTTKTPAGWSDAVITIPYELYFQYGDKTLLSDNYEAMKEWIDFLLRFKFTPDKEDYVRDDGNYGDHLAYFNNQSGVGYAEKEYNGGSALVQRETTYSEIGTAYTAYSTALLSEIAGILENEQDKAYYAELSEKFAKAWRENFLADDKITPKSASQTSYVMGIHFDLYETPENKYAAFEKLCSDIEQKGYQTVGFIGMSYLYDTLSDGGRHDLAYKLLLNTSKPSLLYPVTQDATTTWEGYNGGSLNHYVQGSPVRWLYTDILGIDHDYVAGNEGYKSFNLSPKIDAVLGYAKGAYVSANGVIKSEWKMGDDGVSYTYSCTVPANTTATLVLPDAANKKVTVTKGDGYASPVGTANNGVIYKLQSGSFTFEVLAK